MKKLMRPQEVAEMLEVKLSTIYQWTHMKRIPHVKVGRFVRFDRGAIERWLADNSRQQSSFSISVAAERGDK